MQHGALIILYDAILYYRKPIEIPTVFKIEQRQHTNS